MEMRELQKTPGPQEMSLFVSLQLTGCEFSLDLSTPNPGFSKAGALSWFSRG